jgi:type 1 glutamine amidotransferase
MQPALASFTRWFLFYSCWVLAMGCLLADATGQTHSAAVQTDLSKFNVLAVAEPGGHHIAFTKAARPWLIKCADANGFSIDFITNMVSVTSAMLANYRVVLQLDFPPYGWPPEAMSAFKSYIEQGRGGWVGLHHAALLGDFDGYPMWPWFSDFMGGIRFKTYIPTFVAGTVHIEDQSHPCMKGLPASFVIPREEWYTFDHSPRPNVRVLASVDESSYVPDSPIRMGDHPVVWTNEHMAARNIYIFMGHGPDLLQNESFTRLLRNAILWAAGK